MSGIMQLSDRDGVGFPEEYSRLYNSKIITYKPSDSDSCILWLETSRINNLSDNDAVSQWTDLSGNNNHAVQSNTDKQPVYKIKQLNDKAGIYWDGANDSMVSPVTFNTGTVYVVADKYFNTTDSKVFIDGDDSENRIEIYQSGPQDKLTVYAGTDLVGTTDFELQPDVMLVSLIANTTNSYLYLNGKLEANGDIGPMGVNGITIGNRFENDSFTYMKNFYEIIIYNTLHTDSERINVENYLIKKYNLTRL